MRAFTDASCGGAKSADLFAPQSGTTNPAQLDALKPDTTLVTFGTLGGNDIGLVQLAASCFTTNCVPASGDPYAAKFATLKTDLTRGVTTAKTTSPGAEILVIGYSTYLPPGGCVDVFGGALTVEEFAYVQSQIDRMSDTLEAVADEQDVDFVDMRDIPGAVDHTACAPPNEQWIRALNTYNDGATLHPSACGMSAMAQHLVRTLQDIRNQPQTPFDSSCVSAGPGRPVVSPTPSATPTPTPSATPTATSTATPTPTVDPEKARAARLQALRAEGRTLELDSSCKAGVKAKVRLAGTDDHVSRVQFFVSGKRVAVDSEAPFRVVLKAGKPRHQGNVRAKITMREGDLRILRTERLERPRCLR